MYDLTSEYLFRYLLWRYWRENERVYPIGLSTATRVRMRADLVDASSAWLFRIYDQGICGTHSDKLPCVTLFKPICNDKYAVRHKLIQTNFLLSLNLPRLPFLVSPLPWNVPNTPWHPDILVWPTEVFLFRQPAFQIILTVSISSSTSTHRPHTSVLLAIW